MFERGGTVSPEPFLHRIMNTYDSFNALAAGQEPMHSDMSVFNVDENERKQLRMLATQCENLTGAIDKVVQQRNELLQKFANLKTEVKAIADKYENSKDPEEDALASEAIDMLRDISKAVGTLNRSSTS